jgi:hypothetical protein
MHGWSLPEREVRDALFAAMIPGDPASGLPPLAEIDLTAFWTELGRAAPLLLRLGLRATVWALAVLPVLVLGVPRSFVGLDDEARQQFLDRAAVSGSFLVRQMLLTLKTVACLAYLRDAKVRAIVEARGGVTAGRRRAGVPVRASSRR